MKKHILFLFAAALALVGCSNEDLTGEQPAKGKQVTLSATVDMGVDVTTRATTDNITASTVNFKWEEGDKVVLVDATNQNSSVFTVIDNSIDGASAKFTGMALDNMDGYKAVYVGWGDDDDLKALATKIVKGEAVTLPYTYTDYNFVFTNTKADGTLQGTETAFTLYGNTPHIRVQLVGNAKLGKVCYSLGTETIANAKTTIDFGTNGIQLSKTDAKELIIPAFSSSASGFTLYFCYTDGVIAKTKKATLDLTANKGKIVNFGEINIIFN